VLKLNQSVIDELGQDSSDIERKSFSRPEVQEIFDKGKLRNM
jgi:hypothetical protein